jgi:hypothetical protein
MWDPSSAWFSSIPWQTLPSWAWKTLPFWARKTLPFWAWKTLPFWARKTLPSWVWQTLSWFRFPLSVWHGCRWCSVSIPLSLHTNIWEGSRCYLWKCTQVSLICIMYILFFTLRLRLFKFKQVARTDYSTVLTWSQIFWERNCWKTNLNK